MKCGQVQALLVSYLNNETTPSERALIQTHVSDCAVCQEAMARLSTTQSQTSSVLQRRAADASPSPEAWSRLEARLAEEAQPSPSKLAVWLSRLAPGAGRTSTQPLGGVTMRKRFILAASVAVLVIALVAVSMFKNVTPVSARAILDRAYQVQSQTTPTQGIRHIRVETYVNFQALPEGQSTRTVADSYLDLQTGNVRLVTTDSKTGKVLDAFAYDGSYTYSQGREGAGGSDPLTIYRSPQNLSLADQSRGGLSSKDMFDQMRNDPNVQLVGQETWADGRTVYVLRSQGPVKVVVKDRTQLPIGLRTIYFEVNTYQIIGSQETMEQNGKELLISSQRQLVDEILPAGSSVAWDLSDVQGLSIVDDPNREHGDLLPEVITSHDVASKTQSGYLLKTIPEGFSLEISAPPKQSANEPYIYIASYRSAANDYFVIQSAPGKQIEDADETYTTAGGLVLHFMKDIADPSGKQYTSAMVEAPGGTIFLINSTLPRESVKAWAEDLVLVK